MTYIFTRIKYYIILFVFHWNFPIEFLFSNDDNIGAFVPLLSELFTKFNIVIVKLWEQFKFKLKTIVTTETNLKIIVFFKVYFKLIN